MKFVVDENVRQSVLKLLRDQGHDAVSVVDVGVSMKDADILRFAMETDRIVITNDHDFGELVFHHQYPAKGIILLRLRDEREIAVHHRIATVLEQYGNALAGHFLLVTDHHVRIRPLLEI